MHHLLAYTKTMGAAAVLADLTGITDGVATLSNSHYIIPKQGRLKAAYAQGATISAAQVNTPSMRIISLPFIEPLQVTALPGDLFAICNYGDYGPVIPPIDEIAVSASNTGAGEREWAGLWVGFDNDVAPRGPTYTVLATGTTAVTANVWSQVPLTFSQTLPAGTYDVVGMRFVSATAVFGRLIFPGGGWRPGVVGVASEAQDDWSMFRYGRFGYFGNFSSYAAPTLEVLCTGADTAQSVYLDLIKRS